MPDHKNNYPSDVTDEEWEIIQEILEKENPYTRGRPRNTSLRRITNAIFYLNKTGCQWGYLPKDFPPKSTVFYHYSQWKRKGLFEKINTQIRENLREQLGRNKEPSAGSIDSQSIKGTAESGREESGYDGGKKVKGRKRHIVVDTMGYILVVLVSAANLADCKEAERVLKKLFSDIKNIKKYGRIRPIQEIWLNGSRNISIVI